MAPAGRKTSAPTEPPPPHHAWTGHTVQDECGSYQSMWPPGSPLLPPRPMPEPATEVLFPYVPHVLDKRAASIRAGPTFIRPLAMVPEAVYANLNKS